MPWTIDPAHSTAAFAVKHMMIATVKGHFGQIAIDADIDEHDLSRSAATVTLDVASLDTGVADRDAHLRSADFFDAERYPHITFQTRTIEPRGSGEVRITGGLTIRGVTRDVVFEGEVSGPVQDPWGGTRLGISAEARIDRRDWGLVWNMPLAAGGVLAGNTVRLSFEAELQYVPAAAPREPEPAGAAV
jgi:polyisoprenoid-binding protein YceI